ncbi:LamG domain-containing protein [Anatilimnocola floriformis]|uniref:LamG domain-containing protein n=1 Tax=Anatilimnocola floriformis TaxID=2948575 RepID=UPI0020C3E712|nr:LamG domain-containing protein [Anatilimnocola floriformis]
MVRAALVVYLVIASSAAIAAEPTAVTWKIDNLESIGGARVTVVGKPKVIETEQGKAVEFNGQDDALFVDSNPLAGWPVFTAEVIFRPASKGPKEQRFLHFQPAEGEDRLLFETRLPVDDQWFLDTYVQTSAGKQTLFAKDSPHPCDRWYHAAVVVDGKTMTHYVNGQEELAAEMKFMQLSKGQTSIGCRFNKVHWFQGAVRLIRVSPTVLKPSQFLKP